MSAALRAIATERDAEPATAVAPAARDEAAPEREAPRRWPFLSMRWLVSISTVVLEIVIVVGVAAMGERSARRALTEALVARLSTQAANLAQVSTAAILTQFPELTLHPVLLNLREREPELVIATVSDAAGVILGDPDPRVLGRPFRLPPGLARREVSHPLPGVTMFESSRVLLATARIVHPNGTPLGTAYLGVGRGTIEAAIRRDRQPVVALLALLLLVGVAASFLLTSTLLRPIGTLRAGLERIGRGDLATRVDLDPRTEFGQLARTVNRMTADLRAAQRRALEQERLATEMQLARHIQRSLLPAQPLVHDRLVVAGLQLPAAEVGGDYYDTFRLPDGRCAFVVADVAGKGLGGCLVTSMLAALIVALKDSSGGPAALLEALDRNLSQRMEQGVFVTMFQAWIDPADGTLTYASAGHHPALLVRASGDIEWLDAPGMPLGADRRHGIGRTLSEKVVALRPGDVVVQTSDGIHETEGGTPPMQLGLERMANAAKAAAGRGAEAVIDAVARASAAWREGAAPADDETIVAAQWSGARAPTGEGDFAAPLERVAEARDRGRPLKLLPRIDALVRLEDWVERVEDLASAPPERRAVAALVLHELCSNIIEHGQPEQGAPILLWWVPPAPAAADRTGGHFVILDRGTPFSGDERPVPDYDDPTVRRRGRGFGIDLVRRATRQLAYHPATTLGNVTLVSLEQPSREHGDPT